MQTGKNNGFFASSPQSLFQDQFKGEVMTTTFHSCLKLELLTTKNFILRLALKEKLRGTRKWFIINLNTALKVGCMALEIIRMINLEGFNSYPGRGFFLCQCQGLCL